MPLRSLHLEITVLSTGPPRDRENCVLKAIRVLLRILIFVLYYLRLLLLLCDKMYWRPSTLCSVLGRASISLSVCVCVPACVFVFVCLCICLHVRA
jgi:hypothetical protein